MLPIRELTVFLVITGGWVAFILWVSNLVVPLP